MSGPLGSRRPRDRMPTRREAIGLIGAAAVSLPFSITADAAPPNSSPQRWAIVVGVNRYRNSVPSLEAAVHDATRFRDMLVDPAGGRFRPENVRFLNTDATILTEQPTKTAIEGALKDITGRAGPDDVVWFYFSGHGMFHGGVSYVLPTDFAVGKPTESAVSTLLIRELLTRTDRKLRRAVVILDACESGGASHDAPPDEDTAWKKHKGLIAISACRTNQSAWETVPEGGLFTTFLLRGLHGEADRDGDGIVTAVELGTYLTSRVSAAARDAAGAPQEPQVFSTADDLPLTSVGARGAAEPAPPATDKASFRKRAPLGPALVLAWDEVRVQGPTPQGNQPAPRASEVSEGFVRQALVAAGTPVVDKAAAEALLKALAGIGAGAEGTADPPATTGAVAARRVRFGEAVSPDKPECVAQAAKVMQTRGGQFLLAGSAEVSLSTFAGASSVRYFSTVTLTVRLIDDQGSVLLAKVFETPDRSAVSGFTEGQSADKALHQVIALMMAELQPTLTAKVGTNSAA